MLDSVPIAAVISWANTGFFLRHCQYVLSCMPNEPGNSDFSFALVAALNGDSTARSFQSTAYPTHFISIINATTGSLGIVEGPDANDASWVFTAPLAQVPPAATSAYSLKSARCVRARAPSNEGTLDHLCLPVPPARGRWAAST